MGGKGSYKGGHAGGGGYYQGKHGHRHHGHKFASGPFFGFYGGYYDYYPNYYDDCYQVRRVRTAHGWRWRRIYVCDYPYQ